MDFFLTRKQKEKKKIRDFLALLNTGKFPDGYLDYHSHRIDCLNWLLAYYEGRASSSPGQLLDFMMRMKGEEWTEYGRIDFIQLLYFWVKNKEIRGF